MNVNALICQVDQMAGSLYHSGMGAYSIDELRSLAGSLETTINVIYGEIRHRLDAEREAMPHAAGPVGGLLDGLGKSEGGAV